MKSSAFTVFILFFLTRGVVRSRRQCSYYDTCPKPKPGFINIHLVPHSHDDIGWLKTVDQYYYGDMNSIQWAAVQYTIDSVISQLVHHPDRRFIYVETGFFWRWWRNQDDVMKDTVKKLVKSGQLEFVNGGWVMNDEAGVGYQGVIDQMTLGLRFINSTFGSCAAPKVSWQIDPFGHSRTSAYIFSEMSFDSLFFGRLDYQDKTQRRKTKTFEHIWTGSPDNIGPETDLFTGVLYNGYGPPDGFCFDILCSDEPFNDDERLFDYNVDRRVNEFIEQAKAWAEPYRSDNVMMTMGSDFQYMAAHMWYKNLDKLIKYVNARQSNGSNLNLFYSTPSCYTKAVNDAKLRWTVKTDDFFPYASDPHAFWTGYFTSRPTLKGFVERGNNVLQACNQIVASATIKDKHLKAILKPLLFNLQESMAVLQHHDAVAGTAKQHVTDDYSKRLASGIADCQTAMNQALLGNNAIHCNLANISTCAYTEERDKFQVKVYNSLSWGRSFNIRIPLGEGKWEVSENERIITSQLLPVPREILTIPGRETNNSRVYELVFTAADVRGFSSKIYEVVKVEDASNIKAVKAGPNLKVRGDFAIKNDLGTVVTFDGRSGRMKSIKMNRISLDLKQNFYFYKGMVGNNSKFEFRASGAYIFRPNITDGTSNPDVITDRVFSYFVYEGDVVTEVHQVFTEWVSQIVRVWKNRVEVEVEWVVGPIPVNDSVGKEIVTRYTSNLQQTNGIFYTDSNGREILERTRDSRSTWAYRVHEPVAGNYYPVNTRIMLKEGNVNLAVFNDRAQGGTSLRDGEIELMVHRRLLHDDAFGVNEALNEEQYGAGLVARGKHWILLTEEKSEHRKVGIEVLNPPLVAFGDQLSQNLETLFSPLSDSLPEGIHVLTLQLLNVHEVLFRLENYIERAEGGEEIVVEKEAILKALPFIKWMRETNLAGNLWIEDVQRLHWKRENGVVETQGGIIDGEDTYVLRPMEIRTWIVGI